jgi:hypothetical protein
MMHRIAENNPICKSRMSGVLRDGFCPDIALPMPLPAIPSVEQVGESIIADTRNRMDYR